MADIVILGGTVLTMDPERPRAEAVALRGERILAVGTEAEVRALIRPDTEVVDVHGGCVLPGFHDAHVHLTQYGLELSEVQLQDAATLDEGLDRIRAFARDASPGAWILGAGFALERWELDTVHKRHLDEVAPDHPVLLRSQDHHSAWANSRALELAGVDAQTPDPANGTVVRDEQGEPTGFLLERALHLVEDRVPDPSDATLTEALDRAGRDLAARGITSVHHMAYEPPAYWRAMANRASDRAYPLRVWACIPQEDIEHAAAIGVATGQGGGRFQIGGAKFFADGALGSRTAWMLDPYPSGSFGIAVDDPGVLAERMPLALDAGLVPVIHAIGDAANRAVLDALAAFRSRWVGAGLLPRIEHAQHLHPDDVPRFGSLGVVASVQPAHLPFDAPSIRQLLGDRIERAYPWRTLEATGALLAFGSDAPVATPDVFATLRAAVRRIGVDGEPLRKGESLSVDRALAAHTHGAARAIGWGGRSGRLRGGCDADLCVLDHDPLVTLDDLRVLGTVQAGRWTYRAESAGGRIGA